MNIINLFLRVKKSDSKNFALVVDGQTLGYIFHNGLELAFAQICSYCEAVLGCRLSPAQKAQVIKKYLKYLFLLLNISMLILD